MSDSETHFLRMGIKLQGYDQVIALSQANVNETLSRHFATLDAQDEGLGNFNATVGSAAISAEVHAPTIELLDRDGNDGAFYIIHLGDGTFSSDGKYQLPTKGWELAFEVNFAFKPTVKIPDHIVK